MMLLHTGSLIVLVIAAMLVLWRIAVGPTNLDRVLALDVLIVIMIAGLAVVVIITDTAPALPVLVVLAMLGFVGTVSVARFMARRDESESDP